MMYPLFKVNIDVEESLRNVREVLESGYVAEGVYVKKFAEALSEIVKSDKVTLLNSCTSSLTLALKLAGVGPGDEVITPSLTCLATNTPIHNLGGKIVWADIDSKNGMINPSEVEKKITDKTKAIICVDWAGIPAELSLLKDLCKKYNVKLIQDAAHAFATRYKDDDISAWADYTCYSFQAIKHLTSIDGGMLVCDSQEDHDRAQKLKWFGIDREASKDADGNWKGQAWNIDVPEAGYKFHMNNVSAAIGLSQIKHIHGSLWAHVRNGSLYQRCFSESKLVTSLEVPWEGHPVYWVFTVMTDKSVDRDRVIRALNKDGIGAALVHVPNHPYTCFKDSLCELPETDFFSERQISLPCGWWIKVEDVKFIAGRVEEYCERYKV